MSLSEEEKNALDEIAKKLRESDPQLARTIGKRGLYEHSLRQSKLPIMLIVVGFGLMVGLVAVHYIAAFGGFLIMACGAVLLERTVRNVSKTALRNAPDTADPTPPHTSSGYPKEDDWF